MTLMPTSVDSTDENGPKPDLVISKSGCWPEDMWTNPYIGASNIDDWRNHCSNNGRCSVCIQPQGPIAGICDDCLFKLSEAQVQGLMPTFDWAMDREQLNAWILSRLRGISDETMSTRRQRFWSSFKRTWKTSRIHKFFVFLLPIQILLGTFYLTLGGFFFVTAGVWYAGAMWSTFSIRKEMRRYGR